MPFLASALTFDALLAGVPFVLLILVGISALVQAPGAEPADLGPLLERFLPPSGTGNAGDLTLVAQQFLRTITANRGSISIVATLLFVWFSTRLFASLRTALNRIYNLAAPAQRDRHFLVRMLLNKVWDVVMVGMVLLLFLANILVSAAFTAAEAWSAERLPGVAASVSYAGRLVNVGLGFTFAFTVFATVYRYGSSRPVQWRIAMVAATSGVHGISAWGNFQTVVFLVLWAYYSALVFLLGGVVAEVWAERAHLIDTATHAIPEL